MSKRTRTLEEYLQFGADIHLLEAVIAEVGHEAYGVMTCKEGDKIFELKKRLLKIKSDAEDEMLKRYPEVPNSYLGVFYGSLHNHSNDELDKEIVKRAKDTVKRIFGETEAHEENK